MRTTASLVCLSTLVVENHAGKLQKIQINGLLGPLKIVPYLATSVVCSRR